MDSLRTRLLAPYLSVTVSISVDSPSRVRFWYCGLPDELIASGAIEPQMATKSDLRGPKATRRDAHGFYFSRSKLPNNRLRVFRSIEDGKLASQLPGLRDYFPNGLDSEQAKTWFADREHRREEEAAETAAHDKAWLAAHPETARGLLADRAVRMEKALGASGSVKLNRPVGRFQRVVTWATRDGYLIIPDWSMIKAQTEIAREITSS